MEAPVQILTPEDLTRGETGEPPSVAAVIGSGAMGHGIAQVFATAGWRVRLVDARPGAAAAGLARIGESLATAVAKGKAGAADRDAALSRIELPGDLRQAVSRAAWVVEAIPEDLESKRELFRRLGEEAAPEAVLATNTSSLSVTKIAEAARRPERVLGLHFFNPPPVMKLLEIIRAARTAPEILEAARVLARQLGKTAIVVKDSPGFATSRLGVALGLEAMRMLEEGVAGAEDIDRAMELGYGHAMGPLRVSDLVGLDVRLAIAETLRRELQDDRFEPPEILREKVRAGKLGKKTGEGFHRW
ncbi:MAG TPA: 3-hydroxyacyl-CoA dehydrogenase family protein [Candidatus Polarisedimenticolia bacterium]|jgi:3-hydroxybutyryl-CoA dehydrogenase|nr:3-hydroxyacyl-CoA dehydrogenase family protein [Candidatus Polarisedimenticolia bacterium]